MKPIFDFLVAPVDGKRYDNTYDLGDGKKLIISASQEDHRVTQRHAEVLGVPHDYSGPIQIGHQVIVHHNVFRKMYDQKGREQSSNAFVREDAFLVESGQVYMYRESSDKQWRAVDPFIFVSPIPNADRAVYSGPFVELYGTVEFSSSEDILAGSVVSFQPESEYEFRINDKLMYRMFLRNIVLIQD